MSVNRAAWAVLVLSVAAFAQGKDAWILSARGWIAEVPEPLLDACLKRTGGSGVVEVWINAMGMVAIEALQGGEPVRECVALVGARVGATSVTGGYSTRLTFWPPRGGRPDAGEACCYDTVVDMGRYSEQQPPFTACDGPAGCGVGQSCHRAADAGMCIDVVDLWRARRREVVGPRSPSVVHLLPRNDPRCAGVGTGSENVIVRVVDRGLRPVHASISIIRMRWLSDGGVHVRELPGSGGTPALTDIALGRGFSVDSPTFISTQPEGCSSSSVVITPGLKACVLLPVSCRE